MEGYATYIMAIQTTRGNTTFHPKHIMGCIYRKKKALFLPPSKYHRITATMLASPLPLASSHGNCFSHDGHHLHGVHKCVADEVVSPDCTCVSGSHTCDSLVLLVASRGRFVPLPSESGIFMQTSFCHFK